jgi:hypothetical protein
MKECRNRFDSMKQMDTPTEEDFAKVEGLWLPVSEYRAGGGGDGQFYSKFLIYKNVYEYREHYNGLMKGSVKVKLSL